jgi:isoleucyl-tRNA synthetase
MDGFDPDETTVEDVDLELVDRWILSRLQTVEAEMTDHWENFRQDKAVETLVDFVVEDVSRFYIQVIRERMWEEDDSPSKRAAYATFYELLTDVIALFAPYAPLVTEEVYQTLTGEDAYDSVHMLDWPEADDMWRDPQLETQIEIVRAVEEAGSNARQQAERKLRWPVQRIIVDTDSVDVATAVEQQSALIEARLNARTIELVEPGDSWGDLQYSAEADMSLLGPEFGDQAGAVMGALNDARVDEPSLDALEAAVADALGEDVDLTEEMVEFVRETPDEVAGVEFSLEDGDGVVYVDTTLTEDIESEGYAREVIRRVQEMRKDLELDIEEEIHLEFTVDDDRVADLVRQHESLIADEVRAAGFDDVEDGHRREWDVEDVQIEIAIEPLATAQA